MRFDGKPVEAWFGIWLASWPGAEPARTFSDTSSRGAPATPRVSSCECQLEQSYYDVLRNEGIEDLRLLGRVYRAVKISHYREGVAPNTVPIGGEGLQTKLRHDDLRDVPAHFRRPRDQYSA